MGDVCNFCGTEATLRCIRCRKARYCCKEHQSKDWKVHKLSRCHLDAQSEEEVTQFVQEHATRFENCDPETLEQCNLERKGVRDFVVSHPFPTEEVVRNYIANGRDHRYDIRSKQGLFSYHLAKRLYDAGAINDHLEKSKEIRRVGYLLTKHSNMPLEKMQLHFYLVQYIMCGQEVFPGERESYGLMVPPVYGYAKEVESCWNCVGGWMA